MSAYFISSNLITYNLYFPGFYTIFLQKHFLKQLITAHKDIKLPTRHCNYFKCLHKRIKIQHYIHLSSVDFEKCHFQWSWMPQVHELFPLTDEAAGVHHAGKSSRFFLQTRSKNLPENQTLKICSKLSLFYFPSQQCNFWKFFTLWPVKSMVAAAQHLWD